MSYLDKYKVGSALFRTLSECRMRLRILRNALRYSDPAPSSIIRVHDYLRKHDELCTYEVRSEPSTFRFSPIGVEPKAARPLLERNKQVEFPQPFILRIPGGRVLGDGTVLVGNNSILSETTTDFHRKQEYHHLLSEIRIPKPELFNGRLAVLASPGSSNYFHWTLDTVPRFSLLKEMDGEIDAYYVNNSCRFHREWLAMLDIPDEKIVSATPHGHLLASELVVPSFAGNAGLPSPDGLNFVRSFMPNSAPSGPERIYISRSGSRRRRVLNEEALRPLLKQHGFEVVHPGTLSVREQMELFAAAKVIVSPHGAELTNLAYCTKGAIVTELFSPYYLNPCFKQLAAIRGLEYTALTGSGGRRILSRCQDAHHVWKNMRIDTQRLTDKLDEL